MYLYLLYALRCHNLEKKKSASNACFTLASAPKFFEGYGKGG